MQPLWGALALLASSSVAWGHDETPQVYSELVGRIVDLYMYPSEVDQGLVLQAAARGLVREVDWLMVEGAGDTVFLRHGAGEPIGSLSVASMATLPDALYSLERLVSESGFGPLDTDVRLAVLRGAADALDVHSRILAGVALERFDTRLKGTMVGIGATVSQSGTAIVISEVEPGGPAERAGLMSGDVILRIDGASTHNVPLRDVHTRIRGEEGSKVELVIRRGVDEFPVVVPRATIILNNVHHAVIDGDVAYVHIENVSQKTVHNLRRSLSELQAEGALLNGLVLDLRGNTGGSMKEAGYIVDQFVTEGLLLRTRGPDGQAVRGLEDQMDASDTGDETTAPMVVLVDERTASAAEIISGALVELGRAALIGTRSYGKGEVQKVYELDAGVRLKMTVAEYVLANDRRVAGRGLVPDAVLGRVVLDEDGAHYAGFDEERVRVRYADIIPAVVETAGWRGSTTSPQDAVLELGRRVVLDAEAGSRDAVLVAIANQLPRFRAEQDAHLRDAFEDRGINWAPAPTDGPSPAARVSVSAEPDPEERDVYVLEAVVENMGTTPLFQTHVRVTCEGFSHWDELVVPVGRVQPGQAGTGRVEVQLPPGIHDREDLVQVELRADGRPSLAVGEELIRSKSRATGRVRVTTSLPAEDATADGVRHAAVRVRNTGSTRLEGVEVYFEHPPDLDIELLEPADAVDLLEPGEEVEVKLPLRLGPMLGGDLPLRVVVEADGEAKVADWAILLPIDGAELVREPPVVDIGAYGRSAPSGLVSLQVTAADEVGVDHVVVWVDDEKHAWLKATDGRVGDEVLVEIEPGSNRILVVATDVDGVDSRQTWVIRGEGPAAADADGG